MTARSVETQVSHWRRMYSSGVGARNWGVSSPALLLGLVALAVSGCALFRSAINDSPGLRWWLFSTFGASRLCPEMTKRSAPLRLGVGGAMGGNAVGRFFPNGCRHQVDEQRRTVSVEFTGTGYAWTPLAGRIGFSAHAGVEYRADFSLQDDAMYVWARTERLLFPPQFQVGSIENRLVDWARHQSPVAYLANTFGSQLTSSQLASGFTVVRTEEGDSFALGLLRPPERPRQPLAAGSDERVLIESDTAEIRVGQVDFLGPIVVEDDSFELFIRYRAQGPNAEAFLFVRPAADAWREAIQTSGAVGPAPAPPIMSFPIVAGPLEERRVRLPRGHYVVAVDHSSSFGNVHPPWSPLNTMGANSVVLAYRLEAAPID